MICDGGWCDEHTPLPSKKSKPTEAKVPTKATPLGAAIGALLLVSLVSLILGWTIYALNQPPDIPSFEEQVKTQKAKIPFDMSKERALTYKKCPDVITAYVWVGYQQTSSPVDQINSKWPNFGQITSSHELGPILDKGGVIIQVTLQKDPIWNEWTPSE